MGNPEGSMYMTAEEYITQLKIYITKLEALNQAYKEKEDAYEKLRAKDNEIQESYKKSLEYANNIIQAYKSYVETLKAEVARLTMLFATKGDD